MCASFSRAALTQTLLLHRCLWAPHEPFLPRNLLAARRTYYKFIGRRYCLGHLLTFVNISNKNMATNFKRFVSDHWWMSEVSPSPTLVSLKKVLQSIFSYEFIPVWPVDRLQWSIDIEDIHILEVCQELLNLCRVRWCVHKIVNTTKPLSVHSIIPCHINGNNVRSEP